MRTVAALAVLVALAGAASTRGAPQPPRIGSADLLYQGAFLLPEGGSTERTTFAYGGTALAFDPVRRSLFVVGHDWEQLTAEVTVPRPVRASRIERLPRARFRQGFADATGGTIAQAGEGSTKIGGQLVHRGRLYGSVYVYYDAAGAQVASHWARPTTSLRSGTAKGLFRVGSAGAGFVSGYMAEVPPEWRSRLGGPALTGNCCIPIISRSSFGPAVFAFDPARLGRADPVPARPLVHYPQDHPTIGRWDSSWNPRRGVFFGGATSVTGVVFPRGRRSVLFFGTQGTGAFCYGTGTAERSLVGQPTGDGSTYCYDPESSSKGTHAYPYRPQVWAYDANDLAEVRRGARRPWQVKPYATWTLKLPFGAGRIGGAALDPATGTIYVSQQQADGAAPAIHVFRVG